MSKLTKNRVVWPELPTIEQWAPYLKPSVEANWYTNTGPVSLQLEDKLQNMFGREREGAVAMSSATSALSACLIAHNIEGPVICPAFTFQATAGAILGAGCQPVIADVDPETGVVSGPVLEQSLRETGAKAAMLIVPYGIQADLSEHARVCEKAGSRLIIDNAAGLGAARKNHPSTPLATHVDEVFSLHATKVFGIGEGGVVFSSQDHTSKLRSAVNFGLNTHTSTGEKTPPFWGINGKMPEAMAAVGLAVADQIIERVSCRQAMAQRWIEALNNTRAQLFCEDATLAPWQVFPILLDNGDTVTEFSERMAAVGIETRRYYSPSLGLCTGMTSLGPCAHALNLSARAVVLPVRSYMPEAEQTDLISQTTSILLDLMGARR